MKNMITIPPISPSTEFCGRWEINEDKAATTACGSSLRVAFKGMTALICFDVSDNKIPLPHVYLSVDGGAMIECAVDNFIRVWADSDGEHEVTVIMKSSLEWQDRWNDPVAKVVYLGVADAVAAPLREDPRPVIEFVGDSISEGTSVYPELAIYTDHRWEETLVWTNDIASSYSWNTARLLGMKGVFLAYGGSGVSVTGCGNVPPSPVAFGYIRAGVPYEGRADVVVINHGANDRGSTAEEFVKGYKALLDQVVSKRPDARIFSVAPFPETHPGYLPQLIEEYNRENSTDIIYIDTAGWVPPEPLHPPRAPHMAAAENLAKIMKEYLS